MLKKGDNISVNQSFIVRNNNKWNTIMQESMDGAPPKGKMYQSINDVDIHDTRSEF
jgi:hypothetical protein